MLLTHNKTRLIFCLLSLCLVAGFLCRLPSAFGCAACGDFDYIYAHVHVTVENNRMERIDVRWELSEIVSHNLLYEYDGNRNGRLDAEEIDALSVFFLETLQSSDFFTTISVNNRNLSAPDFENLRFEWNPTDKAFSFSVPLSHEINDMLDLTLQVMDPDFDFMFYYRDDSVTWNRPEGYRLTNNAASFPQELEISIQPENGFSVTTASGAVLKQGPTQKSAVGQSQSNKNDALSWNGKLMTTLSVWLQVLLVDIA